MSPSLPRRLRPTSKPEDLHVSRPQFFTALICFFHAEHRSDSVNDPLAWHLIGPVTEHVEQMSDTGNTADIAWSSVRHTTTHNHAIYAGMTRNISRTVTARTFEIIPHQLPSKAKLTRSLLHPLSDTFLKGLWDSAYKLPAVLGQLPCE